MSELSIINPRAIDALISQNEELSDSELQDILDEAGAMKGLGISRVARLLCVSSPEHRQRVYDAAKAVKEEIYGKRMVVFAPMYISNLCRNECTYCAFRARNTAVKRRALSSEEIAAETRSLIDTGHKRVLLVAGESYPQEGFSYVLKAIDTVYDVTSLVGSIRRVNVNIAPLEHDEYCQLKEHRIGTYQLFQETYHRDTYLQVHVSGKKRDYDYRLSAIDRAMMSGIDDVGIGVLFGLADYRFEILALMQHIAHLETTFGVGPHTISVPRLEPATGSALSESPPHPVSDDIFRLIISVIRLAVPYTGIILSTRETPSIRRESFALGVSQISAGSRTNPGGYSTDDDALSGQFSLGDHRTLDEVIAELAQDNYIPSFCTGCYRLGRTGSDFMDLAKPGDIKRHCNPNGLSTFLEYLLDYASEETRHIGMHCIEAALESMEPDIQEQSLKLINMVKAGKRDVYC